MVSGDSKNEVFALLMEGKDFGVDETVDARREKSRECWEKARACLQNASNAMRVLSGGDGQTTGMIQTTSFDRTTSDVSHRIGSLISWDAVQHRWQMPLALDCIKAEIELVDALINVRAVLGDQQLDFRSEAILPKPAAEMAKIIYKETALKDKSGISKKERDALNKYSEALKAFFEPARRINLSASYSATLVRLGAYTDLRQVLERVYCLIQEVKKAGIGPSRCFDDSMIRLFNRSQLTLFDLQSCLHLW